MELLRAACVQLEHGTSVKESLGRAGGLVAEAAAGGARLVLLPEYWWVGRDGRGFASASAGASAEDLRAWLADASRDHGVALAGNVVEVGADGRRLNVLDVFEAGRRVGHQEKVHPMPNEAAAGIGSGTAFRVFPALGVPVGGLVCADVFYPEAARVLSLKGAEVILNPVMSPYREADLTKAARDAVFVARAWDAGAFVLKAGGFSRAPPPVAGRSLVTAPWGVLARYRDDFTQELLFADLDFTTLRAFRDGHRGFQDRVPDAYRDLFTG